MKTVRTSRLVYNKGSSDKAYEVDMCDVSASGVADQFVVNFRYGRRGTALQEGTKTPSAVTRYEADKIFDSLIVSKINKGYQDTHSANPQDQSPTHSNVQTQDDHFLYSARYQGAIHRVKIGMADIASRQLDDKKASRIIWRAGELAASEFCDPMLRLLDGSNDLLEYCLVWALGRCGDESAADKLLPLVTTAQSEKTRRVATWACIHLANEKQSKLLLESLAGELPGRLYEVIDSIDRFKLNQALDAYFNVENQESNVNRNDALHQLYLLSFDKPDLRFSLIRVLKKLTPRPNVFRGMRQVYKAAEFFKDAEVFAVVNLRFDVSRSYYTPPVYGDYAFIPTANTAVRISKEITKPDSRIAYSSNTRRYLRQRTWRSIRRLGELGLDDYVEMAMGILLITQPEHKQAPRQTIQNTWNNGSREINYDEYGHFNALINIAFGAGSRYTLASSAQAWQVNPDYVDNNVREDVFPELWDKHPKALLQLLLESELHPVQEFAAKAMIEQTEFFDHISNDQLHSLLTKQFPRTQELAFSVAKSRYDAKQPDFRLVYLLLDNDFQKAVEQAKQWVNEQPRTYASSLEFLVWVVTAESRGTRQWCRTLVELADSTTSEQLVDELIKWLIELEEEVDQAQIDDIEWTLLNALRQHTEQQPFDDILRLLAHPEPAIQVVAGRLLLNHKKPAEDIPPAVFSQLLESPVAEVKSVGVELFAQLPSDAIVNQPELVESFCVDNEALVRAGITPAIAKLSEEHPDFSKKLMRKLIDRLFRKETSEGLHDDLLSLLTTELANVTVTCEKSLHWRLLSARSLAAQSLGIWLLNSREQNDFTVRQWAFIAHNDTLVCREWAWQCYQDNPDKVVQFASDALRITDGQWEDSRLFAFDYFRNQFPDHAWQPELLISICDSVRGDVQTFGRELLNRFFKEQDGQEYLLKLSQHPSTNVQLFASNYLERFATGSIERLKQLELYFITVLSAVNKSRVCKNRVTQFLLDEAGRSEAAAQLVAGIFSRQSVTMAITDKAKYLIGMRNLILQYPQLDMPLEIKTRKILGARSNQPSDRALSE